MIAVFVVDVGLFLVPVCIKTNPVLQICVCRNEFTNNRQKQNRTSDKHESIKYCTYGINKTKMNRVID